MRKMEAASLLDQARSPIHEIQAPPEGRSVGERRGRPVTEGHRGPKYRVDGRIHPAGIDNPLEFLIRRQAPITEIHEAAEAIVAIRGYILIEPVEEISEQHSVGFLPAIAPIIGVAHVVYAAVGFLFPQ
jgi:hypothetical protein